MKKEKKLLHRYSGFHNTENGHNGFKEMKYIKELEKQQKIEFID